MTRSERLEQAKTRLAAYIQAEQAILNGAQSYSTDDLVLTRGDLRDIKAEIQRLTKEVMLLTGGGGVRTRRVVIRDL